VEMSLWVWMEFMMGLALCVFLGVSSSLLLAFEALVLVFGRTKGHHDGLGCYGVLR
jgi:hypothetical protein